MLKVFIGYDSREPVAFHVAAHSVMRHASQPVAIIPLVQDQLRKAGLYTRERGVTEATEFSMTRFLVPYLSGYEGMSIFMDCDMVCRTDICGVEDVAASAGETIASPGRDGVVGFRPLPVSVCKHNYVPKAAVKMDGCVQTTYERKNWSSVIVFENPACSHLTPEYVNGATGLDLHRFKWLRDEDIGSLPLEWNWLVGEYEPNPDAKILHYTNGGPWFRDYQDCDHAKDWLDEYVRMTMPPMRSFSQKAWMEHPIGAPCG